MSEPTSKPGFEHPEGPAAGPSSGPDAALTQATPPMAPLRPYPGLRPFEIAEADLFFGRAPQVGDTLARLETRRLLAVVGVSGCGKSSLVRAGLIPAVQQGWLASHATDWRIALMRPGRDPYGALADALLAPDALGRERAGPARASAFLEAALRRGRLGLKEVVAGAGLPPKTGLLLVVDQFEEVFRFRGEGADPGRARDDADAFVGLLLANTRPDAAAVPSRGPNVGPTGPDPTGPDPITETPPILVVLTMRSDFLGDCAVFAGLPEAINDAQFLTPRLSRDQYEEAIREPARRFGGDLEPALVARLLNDMGEDPDRLPVLQHALMRMWTQAEAREGWDRRLGVADYPEGGLNAALSAHGDEVFKSLPKGPQRQWVKVLFQALCERSGTRRDTRRPQTLAELAAVAEVAPEVLYPIVDAFRAPERGFLVASPPGPLTPESVIDIGHESLIAHWARLGWWIGDETDSAEEYRRLADAARLHAEGEGELLGGQNLDRLLAWKVDQAPTAAWARRYGGRCRRAMAYLERSRREAAADQERRKRDQAEREATRQRELEAAKALADQRARSARNLRIWLAVSFGLLLLAVGAAWWAWDREQVASEQRKTALESRANWFMAIAGHDKLKDPQRCLLLALEAYRAAPQLSATESIVSEVVASLGGTPLIGHEAFVTAVAFAPDGRTLASASGDRTIRLWDPSRPDAESRVLRGHDGPVTAAAFAPDGRNLASASTDRTIRLWDLTRPEAEPRVLRGHGDTINAVAYAPDGRSLAGAFEDGTVRVWEPSRPDAEPRVLAGHVDVVTAVAFASEGRILASASADRTIRLWDLTRPDAEPRVLRGHEGAVYAIAFAPDGHVLASASGDRTIRLWNLARPEAEPQVLRGHEGNVSAVAFAPDGGSLASASWDQSIRLWDLTRPNVAPRVLRGHEGTVSAVAFAPDGGSLASASWDDTIRLWDLLRRPDAEPRVLRGNDGFVTAVAWAPDGGTLASASANRTIRLWDLTRPAAEPRVFKGHEGAVYAIAFAPGGGTLASASEDRTIRLWDPARPDAEPQVLHGHLGPVTAVAFSPDGRTFASGSWDNTIRLWDLSPLGAKAWVLRGHEGPVTAVAFAPDGRTLASASDDKTIRLWDLTPLVAEPWVLRGHEGLVKAVAFAPDGRSLASGSWDSTVRLWDLARPDAEPRVLRGNAAPVYAVAFAPDGRALASASEDGTGQLWDLTGSDTGLRLLRGQNNAVTAAAFAPNGQVFASASKDDTIRVWEWVWVSDFANVSVTACERVGRNLSVQEWAQYYGNEVPRKTCGNWPIHRSFFEAPDALAREGNVKAAADAYRTILSRFGSREFDPVSRAHQTMRLAAPDRRRAAVDVARKGKIEQAVAIYTEAKRWNPQLTDDVLAENELCWVGSLWERAATVFDYCQRAVELDPTDASLKDSRGVARAQTGDLVGAIADFRAYIAWALAKGRDEDRIAKRRQWIEALEQGRNPFDTATLEDLRRNEL